MKIAKEIPGIYSELESNIEKVKYFENLLIARATNGDYSSEDYIKLRNNFIKFKELPLYIKINHSLDSFWGHIRKVSGYESRRKTIFESFEKLKKKCEEVSQPSIEETSLLTVGETSYLKRIIIKLKEEKNYSINYIDLYNNFSQEFSEILSSFHFKINKIFNYMNRQLHSRYFHADDSREAILCFEDLNSLFDNMESYSIGLIESYKSAIFTLQTFLQASGGTNVPDDFRAIKIMEIKSIFISEDTIKSNNDHLIHLQPIGQGSYARVFKYKDLQYNEEFVLKRAIQKLTKKELERFAREFKTMKSLNHPNIVKVYSFDEKKYEYIMELCDITLEDFLKNQESSDLCIRLEIIVQLLKVFDYLSYKNILHRDISPTNILLNKYHNTILIKVSDFGLVKIPESFLTDKNSELRGSLNDINDLDLKGFDSYEIRHETYALSKLISMIASKKLSLKKIKDEKILRFLNKGVSEIDKRYQNFNELKTGTDWLIGQLR